MSGSMQNAVLVTGGAGFIGSHLCEQLLFDGQQVLCLDNLQTGRMANIAHLHSNPGFRFFAHDVIDPLPEQLHDWSIDRIYHLACAASPAQYQADPEHTMLTNVLGTRNLLRLAERCGARLLLTSTSEVYGDPEIHPQTEDYRGSVSCTGPRACYDEGKRAAETLAFDFFRAGRCDVRVARIFNTYGPRMRPDDGRVISNFVVQALNGADLTLYGDGSQTRSFCFVDDLVAGLRLLMENDTAAGLPVNLGNPDERSVAEVAQLVLAMIPSASRIRNGPLPTDDPSRRRPDIGRARSLLGWQPVVPLEEGLERTIAWARSEQAPQFLVAAE